jgi:chorismate-pyruvate lyase
MSTSTPKEVILAELTKILIAAHGMANANNMDSKDYDFLMDIDVPIGEMLPSINLQVQDTKLKG